MILIHCLCILSVQLLTLVHGQTCLLFHYHCRNLSSHFYSCNPSAVPDSCYELQGHVGEIWTSQIEGTTPLYHYYNDTTSDHLYTISTTTKHLEMYIYDGIAGYIARTSTSPDVNFCSRAQISQQLQPLYQLRMLGYATRNHLDTSNFNEITSVETNNYFFEEILGYTCNCKFSGFVFCFSLTCLGGHHLT